jgi:hypothetical protein
MDVPKGNATPNDGRTEATAICLSSDSEDEPKDDDTVDSEYLCTEDDVSTIHISSSDEESDDEDQQETENAEEDEEDDPSI